MTEAKVSTKAPATTAKKSKGEKERDVIGRIKEFLPQWEIQKVEAFCAEHNHDLDKIHQALDSSYDRTGHQPDDWQVMTKKEQKSKRGGRTEGSRESRPREDRPKGERGERGERGRGRGGGGESRGRGRGGSDRAGRGGGRGGGRPKDATEAAPASEPVADAWGTTEAQAETANTGFAPSNPTNPEPEVVAARAVVAEPAEKIMTWAEKIAHANARKSKVVSEVLSAEAFPQQTQILGPAIVHTQPQVAQPQAGTSYRAALQGNSRWGKKAEPAVDTSMVSIEQQTSSLTIESFQQADYQAVEVQQTLTSDVMNALPVQDTTSSFPQAEVFQPEPTFQAPPQAESFQIYQATQTQASSVQSTVSDPKVIQSAVFTQSAAEFNAIPHGFAPDNGGKLVIDLLSATNSVILPPSEPLSYGIEFGSFGQSPQPTNFAQVQAEPTPQPELKPSTQQTIEQVPTEPQTQLSQTSFANDLRDDALPVKQQSADNAASSQFSQNQYYQSQNQSQAPPQSQAQPAGFRGPPSAGGFEPHYNNYPFPYESQSPYYNEFAARDSQPQSFHYNDQYPSGFRGGAGAPSGGNRRPAANTNQPYYNPPGRGGLLNTDGPSGNASPPTSEPELSPNSAKSGSFSNKPANFAGKSPFNNPTTKMPQIPPFNAKPAGVPASTNYNKQPPATSQPAPKSFKGNPPQGSQSQQHHPDPQQHYMPYPPGMYGYHYPYPYQPPVMQMPYGAYDPRYGYPYPGPVQSFEGEFDFPKAHYSEGGNTPRSGEWSGNGESQKSSNSAPSSNSSAPSTNTLPSTMNATKNTVAPGGANKKPARFEYSEQDPHYNSGYGFSGAPASSPMAMHAAAAPYQPTNYGQPIMHPMGGQAPYNPQFESHRGYNHGQNWQ